MKYRYKNQNVNLYLYGNGNLEIQPDSKNITIEHAMEVIKDIASRKQPMLAKLQHDELIKQRRLLDNKINELNMIISCHTIEVEKVIVKDFDELPF